MPAWVKSSATPTLLLALLCGAAVCFPLTATDTWWHLAAGREILRSGPPLSDPFSISAAGRPWIDVHWVFQVWAYAVHAAGGVLALVLAKALMFSAGAAALHRTALRGLAASGWPAAAVVTAMLLPARHLVLMRPIVFTLVLTAVTLYLLERFVRERNAGLLVGLVPVQLLWANSQGLFLVGPALVGCTLAGEAAQGWLARRGFSGFAARLPGPQLKRLAAALAAMLLACLITPYGLDGLLLPLRLFGRIDPVHAGLYAANVSENVPPWMLARLGDGSLWWFPWAAAAALLSLLLDRRRLVVSQLLMLAAMLALALMANRNVLLFCWVAAPVAARNLTAWLAAGAGSDGAAGRLRAALNHPLPAAAVMALLGALLGTALADEGPLDRPTPFRVPARSAELIATDPRGGGVFCSVRYGGYLIWTLHPRYRPYIDGRLILRTPEEFAGYLALLDQPDTGFDGLQQRRGFRYAVLPSALPGRYLGLARHLYRHPQWCLLHTDGTELLFGHGEDACGAPLDLGDAATVSAISANLSSRHGEQPRILDRAVVHLGRLLAVLGLHERAAQLLAGRSDPQARALLARTHLLAGRDAEARRLAEALLAEGGDADGAHTLLALIAAAEGRGEEAAGHLRAALARDPYDPLALELLAELQRRVGSSSSR